MLFDPANPVIALCARGMEQEGMGNNAEAARLFNEAWAAATTHAEWFTAAHYVARHQPTTASKLHWDETALAHAQQVDDPAVREALPSLHLNIGRCYEELGNNHLAANHYQQASAHMHALPADGYGAMTANGIKAALQRVAPACDEDGGR